MFSLELDFLKIMTLLTGAVIAGEAWALMVGTYFLSNDKVWASKNMVFLILDIAIGLGLIYLGLVGGSLHTSVLFYLVSIIALATHGIRARQYYSDSEHRFCFNPPLFIVNNVKLIGLIVILIAGLIWIM